jgi:hypothetical protein
LIYFINATIGHSGRKSIRFLIGNDSGLVVLTIASGQATYLDRPVRAGIEISAHIPEGFGAPYA